jgi:hypothetical protein
MRRGVSGSPLRTAWLLVGSAALLSAGWSLLATRARRAADASRGPRPFARLLDAPPRVHGPMDGDGPRMHAIVVAQRADCSGNMAMAEVLTRRRIAPHVASRTVLIAGTAADTVAIRAHLPSSLRAARLRLLEAPERAWLLAAGHGATPLLLLLDERRRIRLVAPVPEGPSSFVAFTRSLTHLVSDDPTP